MPAKGKGKAKVAQTKPTQKPDKKKAGGDKKVAVEGTSASKSNTTLSNPELKAKVNALVRYALFASSKSRPIKVADLTSEVLAQVPEQNHFDLIQRASTKLEKVFGLRLAKLPAPDRSTIAEKLYVSDEDSEDDATAAGPASQGTQKKKARADAHSRYRKDDLLAVLNNIQQEYRAGVEVRNEEKWGLTLTILTYIYVQEMEVTEVQLKQYLKDLGIDWVKRHSEFGMSGKDFVQELQHQKYLYKKVGEQAGDSRVYFYRWGPRSREELTEGDIISFLADIYGKPIAQWRDMIHRPICGLDGMSEDEL